MQYAADIYNELPCLQGNYSAEEIFAQTQSSRSRLLNARTWGCPTYVLEPKLRDCGKLPKWAPKTRRGQFVGFSAVHSSTVGLIRNLRTGSITPQFHCVYNSEFQTTHAGDGTTPSEWRDLIINHQYATPLDEDTTLQLPEEWLTADEIACRCDRQNASSQPPLATTPNISPAPPPDHAVIDLTLPRKGEIAPDEAHEPKIHEPKIKLEPLSSASNTLQSILQPSSSQREPLLQQREPPLSSRSSPQREQSHPNSLLRRSKRVKFKRDHFVSHSFNSYQDLFAHGLSCHSE
jgi:hypothetical protein